VDRRTFLKLCGLIPFIKWGKDKEMAYSKTAEIDLVTIAESRAMQCCITSTHLYAFHWDGYLYKIRLSDFTLVDSLNIGIGGDKDYYRMSISVDNTFLILSYESGFNVLTIKKVNLSSFTVTDISTPSITGFLIAWDMIIGNGNYFYVSVAISPPSGSSRIYRFNTSDLSLVDYISRPTWYWSQSFLRISPYVYCSDGYDMILRLNETSFTIDAFSTNLPADMSGNLHFTYDANYIYCGGYDVVSWSDGVVIRISYPDLSSYDYYTHESSIDGLAITGSNLFYWCYSSDYLRIIDPTNLGTIKQQFDNAKIISGIIQSSNSCFVGFTYLNPIELPGMQKAVKYCGSDLPISSILFLDEEPIILI
jgi:hypothetical protein